MKNKIEQLIPSNCKSLERNILELLNEVRKGNVRCAFITYLRKHGGGQRVYWYGEGNDVPFYSWMLDVAKYDLMSREDRDSQDFSQEED